MKDKELKSVAQSLADMATSDRIRTGLEELAAIGKGSVVVNLLDEQTSKSVAAPLCDWWRANTESLPIARIESAKVILNYDATAVPSERHKVALFDLSSFCTISTSKREFTAKSENKVWWQKNA